MRFIDLRECRIDGITLGYFIVALFGMEDDANRQNVKHFLKGHVLALHLLPDAIRTLDARLEFVVNAACIESRADGRCEIVDGIIALELGILQNVASRHCSHRDAHI